VAEAGDLNAQGEIRPFNPRHDCQAHPGMFPSADVAVQQSGTAYA